MQVLLFYSRHFIEYNKLEYHSTIFHITDLKLCAASQRVSNFDRIDSVVSTLLRIFPSDLRHLCIYQKFLKKHLTEVLMIPLHTCLFFGKKNIFSYDRLIVFRFTVNNVLKLLICQPLDRSSRTMLLFCHLKPRQSKLFSKIEL